MVRPNGYLGEFVPLPPDLGFCLPAAGLKVRPEALNTVSQLGLELL